MVNYLTVLGYPDKSTQNDVFVHVVGKDISKFHCVYWPAFLHGAGLSLPKKVLNHGHWLKNKMKMSKSLGNVEDPYQLIEEIGIHSVRSYFLSEGPLLKDSNFDKEDLIQHHNKIICDSYVNMLFRITGKKILKKKDGIPPPTAEHINIQLLESLNNLSFDIQKLFSEYDFIGAFKEVE